MKFIDLFAGLGGFHLGLEQLGHNCVFASEINTNLRKIYLKNFPSTNHVVGDITKVDINEIGSHNILTAGFPCQPFSRAGLRKGFEDENKGNLFFEIMKIVNKYQPEYIILENVETLLKHGGNVEKNNLVNSLNIEGETFRTIRKLLEKNKYERGRYEIACNILSPHEFGIPQHRRRLFIVARLKSKGGLKHFKWPEKKDLNLTSIHNGYLKLSKKIKKDELNFIKLTKDEQNIYDTWHEFVLNFPKDKELPSFPIWAHEWGATYNFKEKTPFYTSVNELKKQHGVFGRKINGLNKQEILDSYIPRYARNDLKKFPNWKIRYIEQNRNFYKLNKEYIDKFKSKIFDFEFSYQKLEWACKGEKKTFEDKIIQFRQSGLRISRDRWFPALTTISTQRPYMPFVKRKMTVHELSQLQSMQKLKFKPEFNNGAKSAYGNAVNSELVKLIAKNLII